MPPLARGPPVAQAPQFSWTQAVPGIPTANIKFTPVSANPYHSPLRPRDSADANVAGDEVVDHRDRRPLARVARGAAGTTRSPRRPSCPRFQRCPQIPHRRHFLCCRPFPHFRRCLERDRLPRLRRLAVPAGPAVTTGPAVAAFAVRSRSRPSGPDPELPPTPYRHAFSRGTNEVCIAASGIGPRGRQQPSSPSGQAFTTFVSSPQAKAATQPTQTKKAR